MNRPHADSRSAALVKRPLGSYGFSRLREDVRHCRASSHPPYAVLHATILHLLGIDHKRLTYRYQGRDVRLTDVHGHVIHDLIA